MEGRGLSDAYFRIWSRVWKDKTYRYVVIPMRALQSAKISIEKAELIMRFKLD